MLNKSERANRFHYENILVVILLIVLGACTSDDNSQSRDPDRYTRDTAIEYLKQVGFIIGEKNYSYNHKALLNHQASKIASLLSALRRSDRFMRLGLKLAGASLANRSQRQDFIAHWIKKYPREFGSDVSTMLKLGSMRKNQEIMGVIYSLTKGLDKEEVILLLEGAQAVIAVTGSNDMPTGQYQFDRKKLLGWPKEILVTFQKTISSENPSNPERSIITQLTSIIEEP